jgi:phosphatidate cytidylyltransferase
MPLNTSRDAKENLVGSLLSRNLLNRILTALPLAGLFIYALLQSSLLSQILLGLAFLGCLAEWMAITLRYGRSHLKRLLWLGGGGLYITLGALPYLDLGAEHPSLLLPLLAVVWSADVGAYFVGKLFQGPKLAPQISPGKTWSGAIGGFLLAFAMGLLLSRLCPDISFLIKPFTGSLKNGLFLAMLVIVSQLGDLIESYAKRCFNIKDSSQILPGHGGFLDRLDSLLSVGILWLIVDTVMEFSSP